MCARGIAQETGSLLNGSKAAYNHALCLIMHFGRCIVVSQLAKELAYTARQLQSHILSFDSDLSEYVCLSALGAILL